MITVQSVEARLKNLDYTRPAPSKELLEELMSDGRTRILRASDRIGLCPDSDRYFEFCLSQVGSFCTAPYNAVEIALSINIQPIYVAAAISLYGIDWAQRLLGLKRLYLLDRGEQTVWKSADAWFGLGECRRRLVNNYKGDRTVSAGQSLLRNAVKNGDMEKVRAIAEAFPHRMMSVLEPRRDPVYTDPRLVKSRNQKELARKAAAAEGRTLIAEAERGSYGDLTPIFNGHISKPDRTRGISDSSETRSTVNGRRFRV